MWLDPTLDSYVEPVFSEYLELDLSTVVPSIAGPKRPQDRIELSRAKEQFQRDLPTYAPEVTNGVDEAERESFPASDSPAITSSATRVFPTTDSRGPRRSTCSTAPSRSRPSRAAPTRRTRR